MSSTHFVVNLFWGKVSTYAFLTDLGADFVLSDIVVEFAHPLRKDIPSIETIKRNYSSPAPGQPR
jgi:hypothetical protein